MADKTLKEIHEEMLKTFETLKEVNDKGIKEAETRGGQALAETRAALEKVQADMTELRAQYDAKLAELQRVPARKAGEENLSPEELEHRAAYVKFLRYGVGETARASWKPEELRSLSGRSDTEGGFLIPPSLEAQIIINSYNLAELRPLCQAAPTGRDQVILGKLAKPTVAWGTTDVAVSAQSLTAGDVRIPILDLKALTLIHNNTLDDSAADVWAELTSAFDMAIAQAEDDAFAVGTGGTLQPQGVFSSVEVQKNLTKSGVAAALTDSTHNGLDALITANYALNKVYRRNGTWVWNSATEAVIRTIKDAYGQYLWQPPVQAGAPPTIFGRPIANAEGAPSIAANTFPIVFGDFMAGYKIRDRAGLVVQRLVERYAEYDQTGFLLKKRTGGAVTKAECFRCIKIAA